MLSVPPFRRVPRPVHRAVGLPSKHLPAAPAACQAGSALVILTVLSAGPFPIALTISYGNSSSHPLWPAQRGLSELSGQPLTLGVFRFCQIYRDITSPPSQIPSPRPSGSPVLPKSLMLTLLLLLMDYLGPRSVVLLVSIPIIILMINLLALCHKNLESVSW